MRNSDEIRDEIIELIKKEDNFIDLCDTLSETGLISENVFEMSEINQTFTIKELLSLNLSNFDIKDYYFVYDTESCVSFCDKYEYYSSIHTVNEIFQILEENWKNCIESYTEFGRKIRQLFEEYEKSLKNEQESEDLETTLGVLNKSSDNLTDLLQNVKQFTVNSENIYFPEELIESFGNCPYVDFKRMKNDIIIWAEKTNDNIIRKIDEIEEELEKIKGEK